MELMLHWDMKYLRSSRQKLDLYKSPTHYYYFFILFIYFFFSLLFLTVLLLFC